MADEVNSTHLLMQGNRLETFGGRIAENLGNCYDNASEKSITWPSELGYIL